jgi:hypothetical protein
MAVGEQGCIACCWHVPFGRCLARQQGLEPRFVEGGCSAWTAKNRLTYYEYHPRDTTGSWAEDRP